MARTAIVTGGTRGIGRAISVALKGAGHRVAAVYHGNEDAARRFSDEASIPVYKWDVAAVPEDKLKLVLEAIPVGRLGEPGDVARMAVFLASDEADFITGATFAVNGGQYMA